jgi:HEAT repeat protein
MHRTSPRWFVLAVAAALSLACCRKGSVARTETPEAQVGDTAPPPSKSASFGRDPNDIRGLHLPFRRSRFADGLDAQPGKALEPLADGDTEMDARVAQLLSELGPDPSPAAWSGFLVQLDDLPSTRVIEIVRKLLDHPNIEVRAQALTVLDGHEAPGIVAVAEQAMKDRDTDIRLLALEVVEGIQAPAMEGLLLRSLNDADPAVKQLALQVSLSQPGPVRHRALLAASAAPQPEIALASLAVMEAEVTKGFIPSFIDALGHSSPEVREVSRDFLALSLHHTFDSAAQARQWWATHQHRFSNDLVEETILPE